MYPSGIKGILHFAIIYPAISLVNFIGIVADSDRPLYIANFAKPIAYIIIYTTFIIRMLTSV